MIAVIIRTTTAKTESVSRIAFICLDICDDGGGTKKMK
jgi:hypothetical protein